MKRFAWKIFLLNFVKDFNEEQTLNEFRLIFVLNDSLFSLGTKKN